MQPFIEPPPARSPGFHFGSAFGGFAIGLAIGAVATFLATVAVFPNPSDNSRPQLVLGAGDGAGTKDLAEGDTYVDESGQVQTVPKGGVGAGGASGRAAGRAGGGSNLAGGGTGGSSASGSGNGTTACAAGRNGGATDVGVTATQIKLGATVAESGIAQSFLGQVRQGMEAQIKKVNRAGGVCGRQLLVKYKDDSWKPDTGARYIQNLVEDEKVFALAVSPSSEGVDQAQRQGYFQAQRVPVVGADGLVRSQFKDPYIWPVAAATTTTVNIMMKTAADRAAAAGTQLKPVVVYGKGYRFGIEGAFAANEAYKKVSGGQNIPGYENPLAAGGGGCGQNTRFCGISAEQGQYSSQVSIVKSACGTECNFMILLLEPKTAQDWMAVPGVPTPSSFAFQISAPQPLFTRDFARNCGDKCHGLWLWTGYNPPIDRYQSRPQVAAYVSDLKAQSASADEFNQFTMGGYLGVQLLVEALTQTGPNLTRVALIDKLNSMAPLDTGLSVPLEWRTDARYANHSAQAFRIEALNGFSGWVLQQEPTRDVWLGQHTG